MAFSPDGRWIAAGGKDVHLWEASTGKWHGVFKGTGQGRAAPRVRSIAFSSDSRRIAAAGPDKTGSPAVYLWDITAGKNPRRFAGGMDTVAFSDKDNYVAAFGGGKIHFWDAASGESLRSFSADGWGAWGPENELFAAIQFMSIQEQNAISIWETKSRKRLAKIPSRLALVYSVTFSPNGKQLATGGGDWEIESELNIWDMGKLIAAGKE